MEKNQLFYKNLPQSSKNEVSALVELKNNHHPTTKTLKAMCKAFDVSLHEKAVQRVEHKLLDGVYARKFQTIQGAFLEPESIEIILHLLLNIYKKKNLYSDKLIFRFSWDGVTNVYKTTGHNSNYETATLQVIAPIMAEIHSSKMVLVMAIAKVKENKENVAEIMNEMNFSENWTRIHEILSKSINYQIIHIGDWNSIVSFAQLSRPNVNSKNDPWCPTCLLLKEQIINLFRENPNYSFKIENNMIRYCFGHGVARLMSNFLDDIFGFFQSHDRSKKKFVDEISSLLGSNWQPGYNVTWKECKRFFFEKNFLETGIASLFFKHESPVFHYVSPTGLVYQLDPSNIVKVGLAAIGVYLCFAYTFAPDRSQFRLIEAAATALKWMYHVLQWNIVPTFHFLTTHAVEFAQIDGTAYFTLQEGTENKNQEIKALAESTFKGPQRYVQLINHLTLSFLNNLKECHQNTSMPLETKFALEFQSFFQELKMFMPPDQQN
jgi:hypothetical protein